MVVGLQLTPDFSLPVATSLATRMASLTMASAVLAPERVSGRVREGGGREGARRGIVRDSMERQTQIEGTTISTVYSA